MTIGPVGCPAEVPPLGEARVGIDLRLATPLFRVTLREGGDALTLRGLGGATIVDAAAWGVSDAVHEIAPIVGGGWLDEVTVELDGDGLRVEGVVRELPDRPAEAVGLRRSVRWTADAGEPFLVAEGAEGFWIHPSGDVKVRRGLVIGADGRVVGAEGDVLDRGGAIEVTGTDRLLVADTTTAWAALAAVDGARIGGYAVGAESVALLDGSEVRGELPVVDGQYASLVPAWVTGVRAEAPGRAPSPVRAAGPTVNLALGERGAVTVAPSPADRWFTLRWTADDGRTGELVAPPGGGTAELGAGMYELTFDPGALGDAVVAEVTLGPGEPVEVPVAWAARDPVGSRVLAGFGWPMDRSREWRGSDLSAALSAAAEGLSYVAFAPLGDVGNPAGLAGAPLRARVGTALASDGFRIASWPWSSSPRKALHGAPVWVPDDPSDALALLDAPGRTLLADPGWLALVDPDSDPAPDLVALDGPGVELAGFGSWFRWLDAHRQVIPTGPATWVGVDDATDPGTQDVEQGLAFGDVCAGTGPLLVLLVDGLGPGATLAESDEPVEVRIDVRNAGDADTLSLIADGVETRLPFAPSTTVMVTRPERWLVAAVWSSDDPDRTWAVTGPVWRAP